MTDVAPRALSLIATFGLVGCYGSLHSGTYPTPSPMVPIPKPAPPVVAPSPQKLEAYSVKVFYATDRAADPTGTSYGTQRADATTRGTVLVNVPPTHETGEIERPGWFRKLLSSSPDPKKDMFIKAIRPLDISDFYKELSLADGGAKSAFLFVHGYNNTFDEATLRTAQIAVDLRLPAVPVLYSWPSQGKELEYLIDSNNAEWAEVRFVAFLDEFTK